eukprot:165845-Karenia_brevis.AAC.1
MDEIEGLCSLSQTQRPYGSACMASASLRPDSLRVASKTRRLKMSRHLLARHQDGGNGSSTLLPLNVLGLSSVPTS